VFAFNRDGDITASTGVKLNEAGSMFFGSLDSYQGGAGTDTLLGTGGHDVVFRYALNDDGTRTGELVSGIETFEMGAGDDIVDLTTPVRGLANTADSVTVLGQNGRDVLWSSAGNDVLVGGDDGDWLSGGAGDDKLYGGDAEGVEAGAGGHWNVSGFTGSFSNLLDGGMGNDIIVGASGNDLISGGTGDDTLSGGAGADTFVFQFNTLPAGWGVDTILDFNYAAGDRLKATDWDPADVTVTVVGNDTVLSYDGLAEIVLKNFQLTPGVGVGDIFGG
jgi:Ca2+-binding RTX toxin-like protein